MKTVVIFDKSIEGRECRFDESNFKQGSNFGPGTIVLGLDGKVYENYGTEERPFWEEVFDAEYEVSPQDPAITKNTIQAKDALIRELRKGYIDMALIIEQLTTKNPTEEDIKDMKERADRLKDSIK